MTVSAFISNDDGYTEVCYLDSLDRMYPAVRFNYRPIRVLDRIQIVDELRELNRKARSQNAESLIANEIASRVTSWEFLNSDGSVIEGSPEPTKSAVLRLKPSLFVRFADVVIYGSDGGDMDPAEDPDCVKDGLSTEDSAKN